MTDRAPKPQLKVLPGQVSSTPNDAPASETPSDPFAQTYAAHVDFVWRTARYLGATPGEQEDIVHDVFLLALQRPPFVDATHPIRPWLYGVTRNLVRRSRARRAMSQRHLQALPTPEPTGGPEEAVAKRESFELMQSFLSGLPEPQRVMFALVEVEGMNVTEAAATLGIKLNTAYSRLRLARHQFNRLVTRQRAARNRNG